MDCFARGVSSGAEFADYPVSPITGLCDIGVVAQTLHEFVVDPGCILQCPAARWAL